MARRRFLRLSAGGALASPAPKRNGPLSQMLLDRSTDILWGRAPVSAWDQVLQDWRGQGGDAIRNELEHVMGGNA